jgi:hypothetical protein
MQPSWGINSPQQGAVMPSHRDRSATPKNAVTISVERCGERFESDDLAAA